MNKFTDFTALAAFLEEARDQGIDTSNEYSSSFIEESEMAKLSVVSEPEKADMPDPFQVEAAVDLMMRTMFDVLRDTRMEEFAKDLAWGFCNSFHMVAKRLEGREDDAARKLGELARTFDPSEIYANELEDTQLLCQTLEGCRAAMECMRDHAAEIYRVETGHRTGGRAGNRAHGTRRGGQTSGRPLGSRAGGRGDRGARRSWRSRQRHRARTRPRPGPVTPRSGRQRGDCGRKTGGGRIGL